jgi:hypothetical protein
MLKSSCYKFPKFRLGSLCTRVANSGKTALRFDVGFSKVKKHVWGILLSFALNFFQVDFGNMETVAAFLLNS